RRLTRREVEALIASGARPRPDLSAPFEQTFSTGYKNQPQAYELEGDRYLYVFGAMDGNLAGKGDIYPADDFLRFARWTARVREDQAQGRVSSVVHWAYYSAFRDRLISHIESLVDELRVKMSRPAGDLDFSYQSLDLVSAYAGGVG